MSSIREPPRKGITRTCACSFLTIQMTSNLKINFVLAIVPCEQHTRIFDRLKVDFGTHTMTCILAIPAILSEFRWLIFVITLCGVICSKRTAPKNSTDCSRLTRSAQSQSRNGLCTVTSLRSEEHTSELQSHLN